MAAKFLYALLATSSLTSFFSEAAVNSYDCDRPIKKLRIKFGGFKDFAADGSTGGSAISAATAAAPAPASSSLDLLAAAATISTATVANRSSETFTENPDLFSFDVLTNVAAATRKTEKAMESKSIPRLNKAFFDKMTMDDFIVGDENSGMVPQLIPHAVTFFDSDSESDEDEEISNIEASMNQFEDSIMTISRPRMNVSPINRRLNTKATLSNAPFEGFTMTVRRPGTGNSPVDFAIEDSSIPLTNAMMNVSPDDFAPIVRETVEQTYPSMFVDFTKPTDFAEPAAFHFKSFNGDPGSLYNIGRSCFANAVIQAIRFSPDISSTIISITMNPSLLESLPPKRRRFLNYLDSVLDELTTSRESVSYDREALILEQSEDAVEYLQDLLVNTIKPIDEGRDFTLDTFDPIEEKFSSEVILSVAVDADRSHEQIFQLPDLLQQRLAGLQIIHHPNTLIINVNRRDFYNDKIQRINNPVIAPVNLTLADTNYLLKSFIYHVGARDVTENDGHYFMLTRESNGSHGDSWTMYNDQMVTRQANYREFIDKAVIYFYEKVGN